MESSASAAAPAGRPTSYLTRTAAMRGAVPAHSRGVHPVKRVVFDRLGPPAEVLRVEDDVPAPQPEPRRGAGADARQPDQPVGPHVHRRAVRHEAATPRDARLRGRRHRRGAPAAECSAGFARASASRSLTTASAPGPSTPSRRRGRWCRCRTTSPTSRPRRFFVNPATAIVDDPPRPAGSLAASGCSSRPRAANSGRWSFASGRSTASARSTSSGGASRSRS